MESFLVSASSYGSSKHSWEVKNSVPFMMGCSDVNPQAAMNPSDSSTRLANSLYLRMGWIETEMRMG